MARPLKWKTPEEVETLANEYLEKTPIEEWTITGLALSLDTTRQTLVNYEDRDEFLDAIKRIKTKIEYSYELALRKHGRSGDIFGLKNFGWSDKQEIDHTTKGDKITPIYGGLSKYNSDEEDIST
jgi:hypothetical protein